MRKENSEEVLYSAPKEKRARAEKKMSEVELFIEAMEQVLANQEKLFHALQSDKSLPEDERNNRICGTQKTIQSVLTRIVDERNRKNMLIAEAARLEKIHTLGLQLLESINVNHDKAN